MTDLKNLPPTMDLPKMTGATIEDLRAELLAARIMMATLVWKMGGRVDVSQADIELATMTCQLHAIPLPNNLGTRWYVEELPTGKKGKA